MDKNLMILTSHEDFYGSLKGASSAINKYIVDIWYRPHAYEEPLAELEDYIRQVGHLPERTSDTRELDRTRRDQQEQNQPPEPETAAGEESDEEGEEIPDEKAEAAKKRLGRSAVDVNKNHTGQAGTEGKDGKRPRGPTKA